MTSYAELMTQAQELMRKAEDARKAEVAQAVADIKALMSKNGITLEDLGFGGGKKGATRTKVEPKYRGPNGELWSGGPGRKPQWITDAIAAGKNIEDYRI